MGIKETNWKMNKINEGNLLSTRRLHPQTQRVAVIAVSVESQHIKSFVQLNEWEVSNNPRMHIPKSVFATYYLV